MDIRQGFWWAASLALLGLVGLLGLIAIAVDEWAADALRLLALVGVAIAIATASHWLNRPSGAADTELDELTMGKPRKLAYAARSLAFNKGRLRATGYLFGIVGATKTSVIKRPPPGPTRMPLRTLCAALC